MNYNYNDRFGKKLFENNCLGIKDFSLESLKKISQFRQENEFIFRFRKQAFETFQNLKQPEWSNVDYGFDLNRFVPFSKISNWSNDKKQKRRVKRLMGDIGIDKTETDRVTNKKVAIDFVVDSESVFREIEQSLKSSGVLFCSISEAIRKHPRIIEKYFGSVVGSEHNYFACLNAAFFSDGTFVYVPPNVKCPIALSTYFRIDNYLNAQMERTLIVADHGSEVSYLEGCSAPVNKKNQLHFGVVEIVALKNSTVNYYTLQNWYRGDEKGVGGVYNFVTKNAKVFENATVNWNQFEIGSAKVWKYPSCVLMEKNATGSFYSLAISSLKMQIDSGTKMIHLADNTRSSIVVKTISIDESDNTFRGKIKIDKNAKKCFNFTRCDNLILDSRAKNHLKFTCDNKSNSSTIDYEAKTETINEKVIRFLRLKGMSYKSIYEILVLNFSNEITDIMPDEFLHEAIALIKMILKNSSIIKKEENFQHKK